MATARRAARRTAASGSSAHKQVVLMLNGQSIGMHSPKAGDTVGSVANSIAAGNGLKSYSILANGTKVTTEGAGKGLSGVRSIEVFAKETRG